MTEALWLTAALISGLLARQLALPPLVGFLVAGMLMRTAGIEPTAILEELAHAGVLLLLFTVGLKLRLRNLLDRTNLIGASAHLLLMILFLLPLAAYHATAAKPLLMLLVAFAFSSTVLAAKVLDERGELRAFHGRVTIGILVFQDVLAVILLALAGGSAPSPFAAALILLPLLHKPLQFLLRRCGHDELLLLYGLCLALAGGALFTHLGLSPELGALLFGILLAGENKAKELSDSLWGLKEAFLVGFFLQVGMSSLPTWQTFYVALALTAALLIKAALFFFIMVRMHLRARSAFLASLSLATYSEFGLIVTHKLVQQGDIGHEWELLAALALAMSFVVAAPLNRHAHALYERMELWLSRFERRERHPDDEPLSLGAAQIIVMGMGRVGTGAYDALHGRERVVGLDSDPVKVEQHIHLHRRVLYADAEDPAFWARLRLDAIKAVLLAMPDPEANAIAARQLRKRGYKGFISAASSHADEASTALAAGADMTLNVYDEAGAGFAEHLLTMLKKREQLEAALKQTR